MIPAEAITTAEAHAAAAITATGLRVAMLDRIDEHAAVRALIEEVWETGAGNPPVTADMLTAIRTAGGYVSGAFDEHGLAAACLGFFAPPGEQRLHSHIAGALPRVRGTGIGFALKLHQRAWALHHGADVITWTFDPLIRRNAHFNLGKLAAGAGPYLPDLYGSMDDAINRDDITDRLIARWSLLDRRVCAAAAGAPPRQTIDDVPDAVVALHEDENGNPVITPTDAPTVLLAVPADIEAMRRENPSRPAAWRLAIRKTLGGLLDQSAVVRGFDRSGWYIVDRVDRTERS